MLQKLLAFLKIDRFLLLLMLVVITASLLPAKGAAKGFFDVLSMAAIALLFFMHGAKLSRQALLSGLGHWRLHGLIFASTFILFPLLGLSLKVLPASVLPSEIYAGFLFLCILPATVQSAIAYTSIARGNVAAAICSASASSLLGVFLSPLLAAWLIRVEGEQDLLYSVGKIVLQLLLPFVIGHLSRPWIGGWIARHHRLVKATDQSSILLVVYVAFSAAVVGGIWQRVNWEVFVVITILSCVLLAFVLWFNTYIARRLGFDTEDEITIVFCASKKSMANGIPMANILFPAAAVGVMVLPLMIFHQIQLMVCAVLAQRYAARGESLSIKELQ